MNTIIPLSKSFVFAVGFLLLLCTEIAWAGSENEPVGKTLSKELVQMKQVVGLWEGVKNDHEGNPQKISVEYFLTAGGSAVVERLFKGSPHEMVSVYHDDGKHFVMTHYCGIGNQPTMKQIGKSTESEMKFEFIRGSNMSSKNEPHMHAVSIKFLEENKIKHRWELFADGEKVQTVEFELTRVLKNSTT